MTEQQELFCRAHERLIRAVEISRQGSKMRYCKRSPIVVSCSHRGERHVLFDQGIANALL